MFFSALLLFLAIPSKVFATNLKCESLFLDQNSIYRAFTQNPKLDGTVRVPIGLSFNITVPSTPGSWLVSTRSIDSGLKAYKQLILKLKTLSWAKDPAKEREAGALLVEYLDGSSKAIQFTSNNIGLILGDDFIKAINNSGILDTTTNVKSVTHLHTHPRMDNLYRRTGEQGVGLSFGDFDIQLFVGLKAQMTKFAGREIPFTAIVIPNCDYCGDLAFVTQL